MAKQTPVRGILSATNIVNALDHSVSVGKRFRFSDSFVGALMGRGALAKRYFGDLLGKYVIRSFSIYTNIGTNWQVGIAQFGDVEIRGWDSSGSNPGPWEEVYTSGSNNWPVFSTSAIKSQLKFNSVSTAPNNLKWNISNNNYANIGAFIWFDHSASVYKLSVFKGTVVKTYTISISGFRLAKVADVCADASSIYVAVTVWDTSNSNIRYSLVWRFVDSTFNLSWVRQYGWTPNGGNWKVEIIKIVSGGDVFAVAESWSDLDKGRVNVLRLDFNTGEIVWQRNFSWANQSDSFPTNTRKYVYDFHYGNNNSVLYISGSQQGRFVENDSSFVFAMFPDGTVWWYRGTGSQQKYPGCIFNGLTGLLYFVVDQGTTTGDFYVVQLNPNNGNWVRALYFNPYINSKGSNGLEYGNSALIKGDYYYAVIGSKFFELDLNCTFTTTYVASNYNVDDPFPDNLGGAAENFEGPYTYQATTSTFFQTGSTTAWDSVQTNYLISAVVTPTQTGDIMNGFINQISVGLSSPRNPEFILQPNNSAPKASFVANTTTGISPLIVTFTDTSQNRENVYWYIDVSPIDTYYPESRSANYSKIGTVFTATFTTGTYTISTFVTGATGSSATVRTNFITATTPFSPFVFVSTVTNGFVDDFGWAVAISTDGRTAIVGDYSKNVSGVSSAGEAYIYTRSSGGSSWSLQATLDAAPTRKQGAYFGWAVALSSDGNTALIGANWEDNAPFDHHGAAYVFTRSGTTWSQQAKLLHSDPISDDKFGDAVTLSSDGNTALITSSLKNNPVDSGAAYVFTRSGTTWSQQAKLTASDAAADDYFGFSAALSSDGNTAVLGAWGEDTSPNNGNGAAYVFTRSGTTWSQQAKILASDTATDLSFGRSVALSADGNLLAVGALPDTPAINAGCVYIFTRSGITWSQQSKIQANDPESSDQFGDSVSLSSDGQNLIVGVALEDSNFYSGNGAVYVFYKSGTSWIQQTKLLAPVLSSSGYFGRSVSSSGSSNWLIVGSNGDSKAYFYTRGFLEPLPDFTGSSLSGYAPFTVNFTDSSTNTPTSWAWDFQNNGSTDSTSQNPSFTYTSVGTYSVKLTATNIAGSNTIIKTNYITVNAYATPVANFTGSPLALTESGTVNFTDSSTNSPTSWAWDFQNNGSTDSSIQNPSFTYSSPGFYSVKLVATNPAGSNTLIRTDYVKVYPSVLPVEILIVGGGGGGAGGNGATGTGGGGAGAYRSISINLTASDFPQNNHYVYIGAGGDAGGNTLPGTNGGSGTYSYFYAANLSTYYYAYGGGGGGSNGAGVNGQNYGGSNPGSGGGGGQNDGGAGTGGLGEYNGGQGAGATHYWSGGGGGGGILGNGINGEGGTTYPGYGNGGEGGYGRDINFWHPSPPFGSPFINYWIGKGGGGGSGGAAGNPTYVAKSGRGQDPASNDGNGGSNYQNVYPQNGRANTGNGGGGGWGGANELGRGASLGAVGGSGLIVIRYPIYYDTFFYVSNVDYSYYDSNYHYRYVTSSKYIYVYKK